MLLHVALWRSIGTGQSSIHAVNAGLHRHGVQPAEGVRTGPHGGPPIDGLGNRARARPAENLSWSGGHVTGAVQTPSGHVS